MDPNRKIKIYLIVDNVTVNQTSPSYYSKNNQDEVYFKFDCKLRFNNQRIIINLEVTSKGFL